MDDNIYKNNNTNTTKGSLFHVAIFLFFAVATNSDWAANGIIWWGTLLLVIVTQFITHRGKIRFVKTAFKLWWFLFFLMSCFSVIVAQDRGSSIDVIKTMIVLIIVCVYIESELDSINSVNVLMVLYVIGISITLLYVLFTQDLKQFQLAQYGYGDTGRWNGNSVGMKCALVIPMIAYLFTKVKSKILKTVFCITVCTSLYLMFWMGSRKAIIFAILSLCAYIVVKNPRKMFFNFFIAAIVFCAIFWAIMNVSSLYENIGWRMEGMFSIVSGEGSVDSSLQLREEYIRIGIEAFKKSPICGYGINNYRVLNSIATGRNTYSHNNFIEILVGTGIIGFISYYWFYFYLIKEYISMLRKKKTTQLINVLFIVFIFYFIIQYGLVTYEGITQWIVLLLLFSAIKNQKKEEIYRSRRER